MDFSIKLVIVELSRQSSAEKFIISFYKVIYLSEFL